MSIRPITDTQAERFRRLAWPLMPVVLRTARCLTCSDAEDLTQETMVKAMRAIDTYQDGTNMRAWLLTILRRTHIDHLRLEQHRPRSLSMEDVDTAFADESLSAGEFDDRWAEPEDLMNRFEDEAVMEALRQLPEDIRWTLLLVDIEQMMQTDAAEILDVAVGTIKSRVHRGRGLLRDHLYQLASKRGWVTDPENEP